MEAVFIIAIIFGSIAAVCIVPFWIRSQERIRVQETLRAAIESGQPMPTEMMETAASNINIRPAPSPSRDLRTGIITTAVGTGQRGDGPVGDPRKCALNRPHSVFLRKGVLYIADSENHRIRTLSPA